MKIPDVSKVLSRSIIPFRFVFFIWLLFVAEYVYGYHISNLGILPRNIYGLMGLLTGPLLHINLAHIVSNTLPLLVLGAILFYFYFDVARQVFFVSYLFPNILVWIFARPIMHIGASGVIYAIASFLIVIGFLRKDIKALLIAIIVLILYGSLFAGLVEQLKNISYEMHIAGIIVGSSMAIYVKSKKSATLK